MPHKSMEVRKAYQRKYARHWRKANKEHEAATRRAYRAANRERLLAYSREYAAQNPRSKFAHGLWKNYALTLEAWDAMVVAQVGRCAICARAMNPHETNANVDHNHKTGRVRDILCGPCNRKLHALESWEHRGPAELYLIKHDTEYPLPRGGLGLPLEYLRAANE